jgi:hypothetical protein
MDKFKLMSFEDIRSHLPHLNDYKFPLRPKDMEAITNYVDKHHLMDEWELQTVTGLGNSCYFVFKRKNV